MGECKIPDYIERKYKSHGCLFQRFFRLSFEGYTKVLSCSLKSAEEASLNYKAELQFTLLTMLLFLQDQYYFLSPGLLG